MADIEKSAIESQMLEGITTQIQELEQRITQSNEEFIERLMAAEQDRAIAFTQAQERRESESQSKVDAMLESLSSDLKARLQPLEARIDSAINDVTQRVDGIGERLGEQDQRLIQAIDEIAQRLGAAEQDRSNVFTKEWKSGSPYMRPH